ncbi:MAG: DsbA family protein [Thermoleophilaceae bacterium]
MRPDSGATRPVFYYDLGSPHSYLAAERINRVLPIVPVWQPIFAGALADGSDGGPRADATATAKARVERLAGRYELQPVRWPDGWPQSTLVAMRAAIFAQRAGRAVAYSLAAFRQAFAAGRDLADIDNVLIAAAACELHPRAVLKGIESRAVREGLDVATEEAARRGVTGVPAIAVGTRLFAGEEGVELAAAAL